jgi:hypothetical protein
MGTFGFFGLSIHRNQINKVYMFKKYEKEINLYMKWKAETEIRDFIRKTA